MVSTCVTALLLFFFFGSRSIKRTWCVRCCKTPSMCFVQSAEPPRIWADSFVFQFIPWDSPSSLNQCFWECSKFCALFFFILQPPGLTVNQFRRIAMYHIFNTLYLQRCLPGLCRSLQPYFAPRFVIHMSHFHNILNQESHGPARTVLVPAGKARNAHLKKLFTVSKRPFVCNLRITPKPSCSKKHNAQLSRCDANKSVQAETPTRCPPNTTNHQYYATIKMGSKDRIHWTERGGNPKWARDALPSLFCLCFLISC